MIEEVKLPWLSMLLDAYYIIDKGVSVAIKAEKKRGNRKLACCKGCDNCCRTHKDIPVYPLELVGIYWYCTERMDNRLREILRQQFSRHGSKDPCPFLIDSSCSIHSLRPAACRQFNVFGRTCDVGEDPYFTRRDDVLTPLQDYTNRAFCATLPFYGVSDEADRASAARHIIQTQVVNLQTFDWKKLVGIMDAFDAAHSEAVPPA